MNYNYLQNTELHNALKIYLEELQECCEIPAYEEMPVEDCLRRYTSEAVYAKISAPHYNACAMDGIAVRAKTTFGATETTPIFLSEQTDFYRVDTGDKLPDDCDAVIMIEECIDVGGGNIRILASATPWQNVRQIGEDLCSGEMIVPTNTMIEPSTIGAMLAAGVLNIKVKRLPIVGIIPSGDELVKPCESPEPGKIIEFNSAIFSAVLKNFDCIPKVYNIVPDDQNLISEALIRAASECDVVLINAGSSAGSKDLTARTIESIGKLVIHGILIRPGKPTILGIIDNKPVIGVPGYPVSGFIVIDKIVKPIIDYVIQRPHKKNENLTATVSRSIVSSLKYQEFVRVKLGKVEGKLIATPLARGAGVVSSLVKADGLLEIPLDKEGLNSQDQVDIELFRRRHDIENALVITGSHDFLIDAIADIMKKRNDSYYVNSSHVGSMAGIMAIKRREAHLAGIHLFDETTGKYNLPYIEQYLKNDKIALIKCVKRIQGLIVAANNPLNINSLADLRDKEARYVNRQKGSGTRLLFDHMLKKESISTNEIIGYSRESFTHISVATLVASGSADAGLGVYTAAKAYGLGFIPVCDEEYDFLVNIDAIAPKMLDSFLNILKSWEFSRALEYMGGYKTLNSGEMIVL